jgi:hypothetical protein
MFRGKREPLCRKVRDMLSEYVDNRLGSEKKSLIERHVETCEACSKELESLRMTVQLLHIVPEVAVPRSFMVPVPQSRRESAFGPASLRWLRPATAIVAIALVVLLMGDFLNAFENAGVNRGPGNVTASGSQPVLSANDIEKLTMVSVPGVMGQMALATAKAVGYTDYTIVRSVPPSIVATPPNLSVAGNEGPIGAQVIAQGEAGVGWPLRQTEIGLGVVVFALATLTVFAVRQRRKGVSVR